MRQTAAVEEVVTEVAVVQLLDLGELGVGLLGRTWQQRYHFQLRAHVRLVPQHLLHTDSGLGGGGWL